MATTSVNIIPNALVTDHGVEQMFQVNANNQMGNIGNTVPRPINYFRDTICGGAFWGTLFRASHDQYEACKNGGNGTTIVVTTLSNGSKFVVKNVYNDFEPQFYDSNNNLLFRAPVMSFAGMDSLGYTYNLTYYFFTTPDYPNKFGIEFIWFNADNSQVIGGASVQWYSGTFDISLWNTFVNGAEPVVYDWEPFDTLTGNGGQYRCKLTMINADKIGDYTTPVITSDRDDFDRISEQASLLSYFQNAPLNTPVTIAWSGDNWLTMTVSKNPEPDTKDYLLNLQFRYALTESIIYSYMARIQLEDYRHIPYLSFIVDDEEEAAVFDCVTYYSASVGDPEPHWGYLGREQTEASMHALWLWLQGSIVAPESDSPFNGGTTDNGGEGGNPIPQDDMPRPSLPSLDAANLGFFTVYNFTDSDETQLQAIADFLWSDDVLDNFKKYFNNFSDNIFALYILPYTPATLPTKNFKVGRMESEDITGVKYLVSRYVDLPMGEVRVDPRWTSYVDYAPYTRFELYLPGIGIHSIDADDIMSPANRNGVLNAEQGSVISIKYTLDLFTGIVVAFVFIDGQMRYQFSGKVGQTIPITGENYSSLVSTFISGAASLASTIASGGLTAPLAGAAVAGTIAAQKPEVYRSGNMSGDVSLMSERTPYLIRHVPNKPEIVEQEKFTGFPSYKTGKVRDFGGYLEALEIHVEELNCCEEERDKIRSLFKSGVIL